MKSVLRGLKGFADAVGGLLFLALFVTFLVQITARFFFHKPLAWTDELAVILYIWAILWASAFVVAEREQVVFDLLWNWGGTRLRRAMRIAGNLLLGGLALAGIPGSWDYVHFMAREGTPVLGLSFQWVFLPLVLLLLSIVVRSAVNIVQSIRGQGLEAPGIAP